MTGTPQPLPPYSRRLRTRRFEAWVGEPIPGGEAEGRSRMIAEGRFVSLEDAKAWVAATYPDAPVVRYTFFSARDGWRPHSAG